MLAVALAHKLLREVEQERLTQLDRAILFRAKEGILVITAADERDPVQRSLRVGRLQPCYLL